MDITNVVEAMSRSPAGVVKLMGYGTRQRKVERKLGVGREELLTFRLGGGLHG